MPELPEVETIKRDLSDILIGRKIRDLSFLWTGILKGDSIDDFKKQTIGFTVKKVERRAKNINIELSNEINILFHMKMTGHLIVTDDCWKTDKSGKWIKHKGKDSPLYDPLNQYIRTIIYLDNGKMIAFSDLRKFAYMRLFTREELTEIYSNYGPEPFSNSFTAEYLSAAFKNKNVAIKKVLLDQKVIAGIGNIYADEILWKSKIHPLKRASQLNQREIGNLRTAAIGILKRAVEMRGTSTSDFRDTSGKKGNFGQELTVYRRTGLPCKRDKTAIVRISVGGRGTHFCPTCQQEEVRND